MPCKNNVILSMRGVQIFRDREMGKDKADRDGRRRRSPIDSRAIWYHQCIQTSKDNVLSAARNWV